jgi:hypothetical protein
MTAPRAVGVHLPYAEVPASVRAWAEETLGSPVVGAVDQLGGMSPGCATRLECADGTRAFVKAVGAGLNPDTPGLFRREIAALRLIGQDPLWASLLAAYDDGTWVAILLEDVPGRHPDLADDAEMDLLLESTDRLGAALAQVPVPTELADHLGAPGYVDTRDSFATWYAASAHLADLPGDLLPAALRPRAEECRALVAGLLGCRHDRLVHRDIRNDNLVLRPDGRLVFVDWGTAAVGPDWVDPLLARLERVDTPWFDASLAGSPALAAAGDDLVTGFLLGLGAALAWRSTQRLIDVGLPTLNEFRRTEARRFLAAAARRLG